MSSLSPPSPAQVLPVSSPLPASDDVQLKSQDFVLCYVNGRRFELHARDMQPEATLLTFLRNTAGLSGTKLVCGEGGCGACTVLVSKVDRSTGRVVHASVNACLYPLGAVDGCHVITVEGIGSPKVGLHPIQLRLAELNGSQCGFCTPGIVVAFYALVRNHPSPTRAQIEHVLDGNLCRCTGYRPILDAAKSFAVDRAQACGMGENCCRNAKRKAIVHEEACKAQLVDSAGRPLTQSCSCAKAAQLADVTEPTPLAFKEDTALIFPPALMKYRPSRIVLQRPDCVWIKPASLRDLAALKTAHPDAKLVCGNTEAGIDMKFRFDSRPWKTMLHCSDVEELTSVQRSPQGLTLGASVTIATLQRTLQEDMEHYDEASTLLAKAILAQIHWFAGTQIRNVATLAGNICTASPISDLNPVWQAVEGVRMRVTKHGRDEDRVLSGSAFFTGYRQTAMEAQELLVSLFVPLTHKQAAKPADPSVSHARFTHAYKQSRRRADDIAIVTSCMQLDVSEGEGGVLRFTHASLSYGGMAPATALAKQTAAFLVGKPATLATVQEAMKVLRADFPLLDAAVLPGGMAEYRMVLAASFLLKMFYFVWRQIKVAQPCGARAASLMADFPADAESAATEFERDVSAGSQTYRVRETIHEPLPTPASENADAAAPAADSHADVGPKKMVVRRAAERNLVGDASAERPAQSGEAVRHLSALKQASGEAKYLDDIPAVRDELHVALVVSTEPHARIVSIDSSALEADPRYCGFWTAKDIPGSNNIGDIIKDEELYASEFAVCVGTIIGTVCGRTQIEAQQLAKLVRVTYEKLTPILTIDEAIAAKSFIAPWTSGHTLRKGDVEAAIAGATHTLEGEARIGGQEHFYLETMACIITPGEDDEMHIIGTTQNPNKTQEYVARVLGIGAHKVVCSVKRLGGGFGGKETRCLHLIAAAAIAARKTGRTVRLVLDRDQDMCITGQRHAFVGKYRVGFEPNGKIVGAEVDLYANGGCSADLTMPVVDRALMHVDNAYDFGAIRFTGTPCKTNLPSNTAFRGFGGPQGMFVGECMIDGIARHLGLTPEQVRYVNLYQDGAVTPYLQRLQEYTVPQQWAHLVSHVDLEAQRASIAAFNAANRHRKRGLAVIPTKFGIAFTAKFLNQAGALVLVYADGSVLINHGGVEIGQGLHTKMAMVAAAAFQIPLSKVHVGDTATDKVANASPTAASAASDLNGAAVMDACNQILARLAPLRKANPTKTWPELCNMAYFERVSLCAFGSYATPNVGYDWIKQEGTVSTSSRDPFNYFTTGVAFASVEVDTLTGDNVILSTHILMDVGVPLNPSIDIGQIEGAFMQGVGLFTMEELVWGDSAHPWVRPGQLQTRGPGTYKLPTADDVPLQMHVELWAGGANSRAIFSSKGVGEPPLFMAAAVFFAIKAAIQAHRVQELGAQVAAQPFTLHSPATAERIRMACADTVTDGFMKPGAKEGSHAHFQTLGSF